MLTRRLASRQHRRRCGCSINSSMGPSMWLHRAPEWAPIGFLNGFFLNGLPSSISTGLDSMAFKISSYTRLLNDSSQCSSSISTGQDASMIPQWKPVSTRSADLCCVTSQWPKQRASARNLSISTKFYCSNQHICATNQQMSSKF